MSWRLVRQPRTGRPEELDLNLLGFFELLSRLSVDVVAILLASRVVLRLVCVVSVRVLVCLRFIDRLILVGLVCILG